MMALRDISIHAGAFRLDRVTLEIPGPAYGVLMGRTGCGKTTLIEILCGLRKPASGQVVVGGRDVTREPPGNRGIGYVPQEGALFPTMTVGEQIGFAPKLRGWPKHEIAVRVNALADQLGIAHLLDRKPHGLSGGERQRVALGRALAARPAVLLFDEPLSAVDEETRGGLRDLLKGVQRDLAITVLHVTHDRGEARDLADLLFVLRDGKVMAADTEAL